MPSRRFVPSVFNGAEQGVRMLREPPVPVARHVAPKRDEFEHPRERSAPVGFIFGIEGLDLRKVAAPEPRKNRGCDFFGAAEVEDRRDHKVAAVEPQIADSVIDPVFHLFVLPVLLGQERAPRPPQRRRRGPPRQTRRSPRLSSCGFVSYPFSPAGASSRRYFSMRSSLTSISGVP